MIHRAPSPAPRAYRQGAFTLIELLVVIGIIAVLISILVPTISRIRVSAQAASTKNFISQLTSAIERYSQDFGGAYPGPLSYDQIYTNGTAPTFPGFANAVPFATVTPTPGFDTTMANPDRKFTMSENLVLGLLGGLRRSGDQLNYNPALVGQGPISLNAVNPKKYNAYIDPINLSWRDTPAGKNGRFADDAGSADDSFIPEFVDSFSDPMPVLYLRGRKGSVAPLGAPTAASNFIITDLTTNARLGHYDLSQIIAYTATNGMTTIGVGKGIRASAYKPTVSTPPYPHGLTSVDPTRSIRATDTTHQYPYEAYSYFQSPSQPNTPRNQNGYILISAGIDRVYGTADDITNFGDVNP